MKKNVLKSLLPQICFWGAIAFLCIFAGVLVLTLGETANATVTVDPVTVRQIDVINIDINDNDGNGSESGSIGFFSGEVVKLQSLPNLTAQTAYLSLATVQVLDNDGVDILGGTGANMPASNYQFAPTILSLPNLADDTRYLSIHTDGLHSVSVTGMTPGSQMKVKLFIK